MGAFTLTRRLVMLQCCGMSELEHLHFFEPMDPTKSDDSVETFGGGTNPDGIFSYTIADSLGQPFPLNGSVQYPVTIHHHKSDDDNSIQNP
mmetsp:Transcript_11545/g.18142  ORF Transcript_11545/g.18142 Transcript_11545/m.18142 type:complete len:91 (-) Transcript_11545:826-1098(-)